MVGSRVGLWVLIDMYSILQWGAYLVSIQPLPYPINVERVVLYQFCRRAQLENRVVQVTQIMTFDRTNCDK